MSAAEDKIATLEAAVKYLRQKICEVDSDNRDLGTEIRDLQIEIVRLQPKKRPAEDEIGPEEGEVGLVEVIPTH